MTIKDISGNDRLQTPILKGSKRVFSLMKEDYILLKLIQPSPIPFRLGDYVEDNRFGLFEIISLPSPKYNRNTGGYEYDLQLDAHYRKWKNKILKFAPLTGGQEASFRLTATLDIHLGVVLECLQAFGYTYKGTAFTFSIDSTVENSSKLITYENTNILDALTMQAETWGCEWWITDSVIHFGRCEYGTAVKIEIGKEASDMTRSESKGTFATRIYAFGSTRNIPHNYRPIDESVVVNGVVQKRLMLPEGTPYIDAYRYDANGNRMYIGENGYDTGTPMPEEEAIEDVVLIDDIYPRTQCVVGSVGSYTDSVTDEETNETRTATFYYVTDSSGLAFDGSYILEGEELRMRFESGLLNGMDFGAKFHKAGTELAGQTLESDVYEIVANEDYGRLLPDETLNPEPTNKFVLYGWDSSKIAELGLVSDAEQELKGKAEEYVKRSMVDDGTYNTSLDSEWVHADEINRTFDAGQRIELVNQAFFEDSRISRVVGYEIKLDIPWDSPLYHIGESTTYSRIGEIEDKVETLTYKGKAYIGGGGSGIYVIKRNDSTAPSDSNVFSALRALATFIRRDIAEKFDFLTTFLKGIVVKKFIKVGEFITGISGAYLDENGDMEVRSITARSHASFPEIRYNRMTFFVGYNVISPGGGFVIRSIIDNGDGTYTIAPEYEEGEPCGLFVDDIYTGYWHNVGDTANSGIQGFGKVQYRVVSVDYNAKTAVIAPNPDILVAPQENLRLGQTGNFTNTERQTYIIIDSRDGNCCITFFDNANTWDPEPAQMKSWFGKKKGMTINGIPCDNYSAVLQNIIMTGIIFQVDEITGQSVRVPIDKGDWVAGAYGYYNRVGHNGSMWLCVAPNGTTTEPTDNNPAWLKQVAAGTDGKDGVSIVGGGHWESSRTPYKANVMVTLANSVFVSLVETSNPPIIIARFKGGSFRRKRDGGYILAGVPSDWSVHPDWQILIDGRELKGESITFLGEFATAPSNPSEGSSYYNIVDGCTYIYRKGYWMVMTKDGTDGKDGDNYDWIYQRGNIIGNPPAKPDSQQTDDYVPEGWTDDMIGVDEDNQIEWACKRRKQNGIWGEFSTPAVHARWAKDGESNVIADFDNEMDSVALTSEGKTTSAQSFVTNVFMFHGITQLSLSSITYTAATGLSVAADKSSGKVTISVASGVSLDSNNAVKITVTAQYKGQNYSRDLTFTLAGVRAGINGTDGDDAVLYRLIPSVSNVKKAKDGTYSVSSVSCSRSKTVGGNTMATTDGILKYSIDGGTEQTYNSAIASSSFSKSLKFILYIGNVVVDIESVTMLADGTDGINGTDGTGITNIGHWESSKTPVAKNAVATFARGSYLSLINTSNPPIAVAKFKNGAYRRKKDGGYILLGKSADKNTNNDWQLMAESSDSVSYSLESPVTVINFTSLGVPSPSTFTVRLKRSLNGNVGDCADLYLVARKYNSSWLAHVSPVKAASINVPATAGYTQFTVRAYYNLSDANAWNDNYVAERGVGVAKNASADDIEVISASDRNRYEYGSDDLGPYIWNDTWRDRSLYPFNGVYYVFYVKSYGSSVTVPPSSPEGDANWEAVSVFRSMGVEWFIANHAALGTFRYDGDSMKSVQTTNDVPNIIMNANTGYSRFQNTDVDGIVRTTQLYCKSCVSSLTDGSIITNSGTYIAPSLPVGYSCVVRWVVPTVSRSVHLITINAENSSVGIAVNGDSLNLTDSVSFQCDSTAGVIMGVNEGEFTRWTVIQHEKIDIINV